VWLDGRFYYVSINKVYSVLYELRLKTVQGSILGPVLYIIFRSPLFDLYFILAFADDNSEPKIHGPKSQLITDMEKALEGITKGLKKSSLLVNFSKI
jgi:hypothetical protein